MAIGASTAWMGQGQLPLEPAPTGRHSGAPPTEAGAGRSARQRVKVQQGPAEGLQPPAAATSSCSLRVSSSQELGASGLRTLLRLFSVPTGPQGQRLGWEARPHLPRGFWLAKPKGAPGELEGGQTRGASGCAGGQEGSALRKGGPRGHGFGGH